MKLNELRETSINSNHRDLINSLLDFIDVANLADRCAEYIAPDLGLSLQEAKDLIAEGIQ